MIPPPLPTVAHLFITRELFIDTIEAIRRQFDHDDKYLSLLCALADTDHAEPYRHQWISNALIGILQQAMNDTTAQSWIEYYMFELCFGAKYTPGCVTHHGQAIPLTNHGELYDFLLLLSETITPL